MMTLIGRRGVLLAGIACLTAGCSGGAPNAPVDAAAAQDALKAALDSWKRGDKPDALQKASPPVFVIDPEWQAGAVLKDYRLAGDGKPMDANLHCPVTLTVRAPNGTEATREVTFIVSTAPNRTVSRKVF